MTRFVPPLPDPPRRIYPPFLRRLAFFIIGCIALLLRFLTAPLRLLRATPRATRPLLIFEPFGLGDTLRLQPLVHAWLAAGRSVYVAARPVWAPLFAPHPNFRFIPVKPAYADPNPGKKYANPIHDLLYTASTLRPFACGADCIDPRGDVRALAVLYLASAARVFSLRRYFSANDCRIPPFAAHLSPVSYTKTRAELSHVWAPPNSPCTQPSLAHLRPRTPAPDPLRIALIPCTPWRGKRWPDAHWETLVAQLQRRGWKPVFLCGPHDTPLLPPLSRPIPVLAALAIPDWVESLATCSFVISVNTGPMHIADVLQKPLIVLDGPSRLPLWAPENPNAIVLHHQDIVPWAPVAPIDDGFRCQNELMAKITPEEVLSHLPPLP